MVHLIVSTHETSAFPAEGPGQRNIFPFNSFRRAHLTRLQYSLTFWPPNLLAAQTVLTVLLAGHRGFYIRAYRSSLPPYVPNMLVIRTDQLMT